MDYVSPYSSTPACSWHDVNSTTTQSLREGLIRSACWTAGNETQAEGLRCVQG
jgi:hypothetical protein